MREIPVSVMWWLTVGAYGVTAVLCLLTAFQTKPTRRFWSSLALGILLLGLNKQQDLTGILTRQVRTAAWQDHWYFARQPVQLAIIAAAGLIFGLLLLLLVRKVNPASRWQGLALFGLVFLTGFAIVRAVSLHAIDAFLYRRIGGIQPNWIVELSAIILVALPAILGLVQQKHTKEFT
jgi:ABC-type Mn2+/Zn2+ transport system permease subunit